MSSRPDPDVILRFVAAAARGDRAAFRALYDAYVQRVHAQVGRLVGWGAAAEDVTQEVFIQVFASLPSYRGESDFGAWLHRLARNVAISHLRQRAARAVDLADYRALSDAAAEPDLDARRQVGALRAALAELPDDAREAFVAFELEGMTLAAIAAEANAPLHTVASRIRRARERLRAVLERVALPWRKAR